jgi:hypothetical protein
MGFDRVSVEGRPFAGTASPAVSGPIPPLVVPFAEVGIGAIAQVGGKNASLGEMIRELGGQGVRVPDGFATTADAYRHFIACNGLAERLHALLDGLDSHDIAALQAAGAAARSLLLQAPLPDELQEAITAAYRHLGGGAEPAVAVRSSATAEDLPDASFAGQQETFLNVQGEAALRGGSLDRRAAHGASRPGGFGGDVQHRHRDRLSRCGAAHRRLRPGRERGAGHGEPR